MGPKSSTEPGNTDLAGSFDLDLQDGDNVVRVRLASKTGGHPAETYGSDKFHYKVKATDVLVSNLGQAFDSYNTISEQRNTVRRSSSPRAARPMDIASVRCGWILTAASGTIPRVSIYSDSSGQPGSSLKILTNPGTIPTSSTGDVIDFGADNYRLDPITPYWIVVERASGSGGNILAYYTGS